MSKKLKAPPSPAGDPVLAGGIKRALDAKGIKPADLARLLNLSPQAVSQWLQLVTTPSARRLNQIATALGVSVESLRHPQPTSEPQGSVPGLKEKSRSDFRLRPYSVGSDARSNTEADWIVPSSYFRGIASDQPDLAIMRVAGNGLEPDVRAGELVVADCKWRSVSVAGLYLLNDPLFPDMRHCEPVIGAKNSAISVGKEGSRRDVPAASLTVLGRVICKLLVPL
jgi:transcriptional regulator with XRE-family HTH domain